MFSRVFALTVVLGLSLQASAHAIINPALGVTGTPSRNDVQRPSKQSPCGNVNIAQTLGSTQPISLQAQGTFAAVIQNFNAGQDGSRQVTAQIDPTGTGNSFVAATVTQNGDLAPTDVGTQQLSVQVPAGTTCTGGASKNLCLVSFTTAGGFGNCVAVQQGGAAPAAAANATAASATAATAANATVADTAASATASGAHPKHKHPKQKADARAYGSRAARALRRAMEDIQEWM